MTEQPEKIRCYELDFGDTNLISPDEKEILNWIEADMKDQKEGDELEYKITIKMLTRKEMNSLPEWA